MSSGTLSVIPGQGIGESNPHWGIHDPVLRKQIISL